MNRIAFLITTISLILLSNSCKIENKITENRILVYTKAAEYVHKSTVSAAKQIIELCAENNIHADSTSDASYFSADKLKEYDAVMFLSTSGDVLNEEQKTAFQNYYRQGKGFVGIHCATCTEYSWEWYGELVGTYFTDHPKPQPATLYVINNDHISTRHLPAKWERHDEWYNFKPALSKDITVLIEIDENTYTGGTHGAHHPFTWYHDFDGGRSWYTAGGHFEEHYTDHLFMQHILGGILYAIGKK